MSDVADGGQDDEELALGTIFIVSRASVTLSRVEGRQQR